MLQTAEGKVWGTSEQPPMQQAGHGDRVCVQRVKDDNSCNPHEGRSHPKHTQPRRALPAVGRPCPVSHPRPGLLARGGPAQGLRSEEGGKERRRAEAVPGLRVGSRGQGCDAPRRSSGLHRGPTAAHAGGARPGRGSGMAGTLLRPALLVLLLASGRPALAGRAKAGPEGTCARGGRGGPAAVLGLLGALQRLVAGVPAKAAAPRGVPRAWADSRRSPSAGSGGRQAARRWWYSGHFVEPWSPLAFE